MSIDRRAYEAIKLVVGEKNLSEDPAVIQSYMLQVAFGTSPSKIAPSGLQAVVLPGSTEEVQAIMEICTRCKIPFKAHSVGWGLHGLPLREGSILLDMRRMDRIIKIDERNMFAVIEPYVTARELQVEAMKKGLTCHVIGAGCQHSVLASSTSGWGMGVTANTMSHNSRNLLGFEWVLPSGEIIRTGAVQEGSFGDPGPSLRGCIRGYCGHTGGIGVFTKVAIKLYPWPDRGVPEVTGQNPRYGWKLPENIKLYLLRFPSWEHLSDACYKLNEEEITYILWSYSPNNMALSVTVTNKEYQELWKMLEQSGQLEENRYPMQVSLAARSKEELEYKEKVLKDIMAETGATEFLPDLVTQEQKEILHAVLISQYSHAMIYRPTGEFGSTYGTYLTWDDNVRVAKACHRTRSKYIKEGQFMDDGPENMWGGPEEQYVYGHNEGLFIPNPSDQRSMEASSRFIEETDVKDGIEQDLLGSLSIPLAVESGQTLSKDVISKLSDYYGWAKKIKDAFDPDNLAEGTAYLKPDDLPK